MLRVGILGSGGIGARHAKAVAALGDEMTLVASCGRDETKVAAFAAAHGGAAYTDFERMLDEAPLDLLVVALPPFAHTGQLEMAARRGINILAEKPIALDMERANAMLEATRGVTAACGFMYRFGAAVERWEALTAGGETGRIGHFSGHFHCNALHADWWREREVSGGQMVEQLIHIADLARHWLGMPKTVYARASNLFHRNVRRYTSEDASAIILGYDDGRIGVLHASNIATPRRWMKGWQVLAEQMTGIFSDYNAAEIIPADGAAERIASDRDVFVAQLVDVAAAIREKRAPKVPLSDGADSLRLVLAARQSADEGREVAL